MKLEEIKEKLLSKGVKGARLINGIKTSSSKTKRKTTIIGITGSRGKSTSAFLLHSYLKEQGFKSVLYSSIMIDSPCSKISNQYACEVSIQTERHLLTMIEEVLEYSPDFLIIEVNDSIIENHLLELIDFDIKVLTNLNPKHNMEDYTEEEYVALKKSFLTSTSNDCKIIIGFKDYDKELLNQILSICSKDKIVFSSEHILTKYKVGFDLVNCFLYELYHSLSGMSMDFKLKNKDYHLETNLIMNFNAFNILCVICVIEMLGLFEIEKFQKFISKVRVPGRCEQYDKNKAKIIIDSQLPATLYELYQYKLKHEVNNIHVVLGSIGYGYQTWDSKFFSNKHKKMNHLAREYSMNLLNDYADYVYLTESDNAAEDIYDLCNELKSYLSSELTHYIIVDREEAIKKAIKNLKENDVLLISGRGNRSILCNTKNSSKFIKDSDIVIKHIKEKGYYNYGSN